MALRVFDCAKGTRLGAVDEAEGPLRSLAFSADGKRLLAGGLYDGTVRLWDVRSRKLVRKLTADDVQPQTGFYGVALSPDGKRAAAGGWGRPVVVWDIGGEELRSFDLQNGQVASVLFSADGRVLFGAGHGLGVLRWDLKAGERLPTLKARQTPRPVIDLQLGRDGKTLAAHAWVANVNGSTTLWDAAKGQEKRTVTVLSFSQRLSPDGKKLVGIDGRGKVNFYAAGGEASGGWQGDNATSLCLAPDGKSLATTYRRFLRLYEAGGGHSRPVVLDFDGANAMAQSPAAFSPDGELLAVCDGPCVLLYDVKTLRPPPARPLEPGRWNWCWEVLGQQPLFHAAEALALLHAAGGTWVAEARRLLTPPPVDAKRVAKLLEAVRGDDKEKAAEAVQELVKLGAGVRPLIDEALKSEADADLKLKLLLARSKVPGPDPNEEALRAPRLVAALGRAGTGEARALL
jgi:WD40 repeat protein